MSFEEWFKQNTNDSVDENTMFSKQFVEDAYNFAKQESKTELEVQIEKMKCCANCRRYKPCVTVNETIGNMCEDYYNGCNNSKYKPFNKWEIKEK